MADRRPLGQAGNPAGRLDVSLPVHAAVATGLDALSANPLRTLLSTLGVVMGAELNAALADSGAAALKGEVYTGPYTDELEVEEPQPGEDVRAELETGGPQL